MNLIKTHKWFLSVLFSVYQVLVLYFFEIQRFTPTLHTFLNLIILFTLFFLTHFLLNFWVHKKVEDTKRELYLSFSFLLSGLIVGLITFFAFQVKFDLFFVYFLAFIVSSFFPTLVLYIATLFQHTLHNVENLYQLTIQHQSDEISQSHVFELQNNAGKTILKLKMDHIVCFEANDNYVTIYYFNNSDELKKNMERISLRKVESLIPEEITSFSRVHKSYIINQLFIEKITGKAQAHKIIMKGLSFDIPVSRSFDVQKIQKFEL
jgi:hypothetical protein